MSFKWSIIVWKTCQEVGHVHKSRKQFVWYNTLQGLHKITKPLKIKLLYFQTHRKQKNVNNCKRDNFKFQKLLDKLKVKFNLHKLLAFFYGVFNFLGQIPTSIHDLFQYCLPLPDFFSQVMHF
jgi:hypothetical protein